MFLERDRLPQWAERILANHPKGNFLEAIEDIAKGK